MMHKKSKLFALVLSVMLIIQSSGVFSYAATDLKGHWSEVKMTDWINKRVHQGLS
jgi:cbb3-type cytochrome oxidase subunit 1